MKIDRSKLKKSSTDVPADCKNIIESLKNSVDENLVDALKNVKTWTHGKCELYHWLDVLDVFDDVLERACKQEEGKWTLACDLPSNLQLKELMLQVLQFTALLIEHSFSRHVYNSMEHLTTLLISCDMGVVLSVLNLLYVFSKRSNFITRLGVDKKQPLVARLINLAENWGGKENGFGLAECCSNLPAASFPASATTLHFEFYAANKEDKVEKKSSSNSVIGIHMENLDKISKLPSEIMDDILTQFDIPKNKHVQLYTYIRLASSFSNYNVRVQCVQARLQALSILVYSNSVPDSVNSLVYTGLIEELVDVVRLDNDKLIEIKSASLRTLTSIIHLETVPKLNVIIDATGASSYHGLLPVLVRSCIQHMIDTKLATFPQPFATSLFSFLYHLASYENGGEALVSCGMMESLLRVINWYGDGQEHITFVTRAVRVVDLITNLDMASFQANAGLAAFINRLEHEVDICRKFQPFVIRPPRRSSSDEYPESPPVVMETDTHLDKGDNTDTPDTDKGGNCEDEDNRDVASKDPKNVGQCFPQRAALLKSMLNFLKKAIPDPSFSDSIRHLMDGSLPSTLKHIISNAEYYGASLFQLATDVVSVYVFHEPSFLSSLQDNGLTDVILQALLVKDVPATREVLAFLPNVFSALCLNTRGLESFVACRPFDRLLKVLLSPDYLPAMRRRRSADTHGDTATNLGKAMDELMRHQPSLRTDATKAITTLLEEVCHMGTDPKYICQKQNLKPDLTNTSGAPRSPQQADGGSSDEEEEEEVMSSAVAPVTEDNEAGMSQEKKAVPLMDYVFNVMKFVQAILSNNPTDDHCREFVSQKGLLPLMSILGLPNLPIDFPSSPACQSVAIVCKAILTLAREPQVLKQGLTDLDAVLTTLEPLHEPLAAPGGSVLLHELANAPNITDPTTNPRAVPLLHALSATHAYIMMFVHVCRMGQTDIRAISVNHWGSELGLKVLQGLSRLYTSLVWESTILLALCSDEILSSDSDFGREDMDKLLRKDSKDSKSDSDKEKEKTDNIDGCKTDTTDDNLQPIETVNDPNDATNPTFVTEVRMDTNSDNDGGLRHSHGEMGSNGVSAALRNLTTENSTPDTDMEPTYSSSLDLLDADKKSKLSPTLQAQIKLIKPLLSVTSRLGRALADLFGLLVKLSVGTPVRQRRTHQMPNTPTTPTPAAQAVSVALNKLLATALYWIPPRHCAVPKLRLTFLVCSVGFTSAMLFYEKKQPYHLMLQKFVSTGGQRALIHTFHWALTLGGIVTPSTIGLEDHELPEGTGEFLDAWLMLMEKMVNPRTILDSPHTLPRKSSQPEFIPFDPSLYLSQVHKVAFDAVMELWNKRPLPVYGSRMCESVLAILCHIIKGEIIVKEQKAEIEGATGGSDPQNLASTTNPVAVSVLPSGRQNAQDALTESHTSDLQQLQDMGFTQVQAMEALVHSTTLEQATEYILNIATPSRGMDVESEEDQMMRAIAMSLGVNDDGTAASESTETTEKKPAPAVEPIVIEKIEPIEKEVLDKFTDQALMGCLYWLDKQPETVYRVCDLILVITLRNGRSWRYNVIDSIVTEIQEMGESMLKVMRPALTSDEKMLREVSTYLATMWCTPKFAVRIHLLSLLFEDMMMACAEVVEKRKLLDQLLEVLNLSMHILCVSKDCDKHKWLAPLVLLIDLYEKVSITSKRKTAADAIMKDSYHTWKWLDDRSGRWCNYSSSNNKTINDSYLIGETSVRFTAGRRRYTVNFSSMVQINEETGNRRPIMLTLPTKEEKEREVAAENKVDNSSDVMVSAAAAPSAHEPVVAGASGGQVVKMDTTEASTMGTSSAPDKPTSKGASNVPEKIDEHPVETVYVSGLSHQQIVSILQSIVKLIGIVDADSLHACLRLALRLTREHRYALLFAQYGGPRLLLTLRQVSSFQGVASLINLLLRHVIEEPATLRCGMEKVIRSATAGTGSSGTGVGQGTPGSQELHYILRLLGPAACRDNQLFCDVIKETLRITVPPASKRDVRYPGTNNTPQILKSVLSKVIPPTTMNSVVTSMLCDLMNALVVPEKNENENKDGVATSSSDAHNHPHYSLADAIRDVVFDDGRDNANTAHTTNPVIISSAEDQAESSSSDDLIKDKPPAIKDPALIQEENKNKMLMSKSLILRLLAECVKSYGTCAKVIAQHSYTTEQSTLITEDCTMLAFVMDNLLPQCQTIGDRDCSGLSSLLIASIASCNHSSEAQLALVNELKSALQRALGLQECSEKHVRLQSLFNIVSVIIEACPVANTTSSGLKTPTGTSMNNIVKMIVKRNLITDLARVPHSLDLSSPYMATTINSALKPLETLSRVVNQPQPVSAIQKAKAKDGTEVVTDETLGTSTAAENNLNRATLDEQSSQDAPVAEADETLNEETQDQPGERSELESVLDDLLQGHAESDVHADIISRGEAGERGLANDVLILEVQGDDTVEIDVHDSQMVTQEISDNEDDHRHNDGGRDNASNDSCSEGEHADHDDDDDEDDDDDDDDDENDEDDDDDEGSEMDGEDDNFEVMEMDDPFSHYDDALVNLEDVFPAGGFRQHIIMNDNGHMRTYQLPVVMTDNDNGGANDATAPMIPPAPSTVTGSHPLLVRHPESHGLVGNVPRVVRGTRTRGAYRFSPSSQTLQLNVAPGQSHHPNPPHILQRLLGPSTAADVLQLTSATPTQAGHQASARILLAGDALNRMISMQEDDIFEELFQDGMYPPEVGRPGASRNVMSCIPSTLTRWTEESKVLDGDSIHDCVTVLKPVILEELEKYRDQEMEERHEKKKKADEEKAAAVKIENTAENKVPAVTTNGNAAVTVTTNENAAVTVTTNENAAVIATANENSRITSTTTNDNVLITVTPNGNSTSVTVTPTNQNITVIASANENVVTISTNENAPSVPPTEMLEVNVETEKVLESPISPTDVCDTVRPAVVAETVIPVIPGSESVTQGTTPTAMVTVEPCVPPSDITMTTEAHTPGLVETPVYLGPRISENFLTFRNNIGASSTPLTTSTTHSTTFNIPILPLWTPVTRTTATTGPCTTPAHPASIATAETTETPDPSQAAERLANAMIAQVFSVPETPAISDRPDEYITPHQPIQTNTPSAPFRDRIRPVTQTPLVHVPPVSNLLPDTPMDVTPSPAGPAHENEMSSLMSLLLTNEEELALDDQDDLPLPSFWSRIDRRRPDARGASEVTDAVVNEAVITPDGPSNITSSDAVTVNSSPSGTPDETAAAECAGASQTIQQLGEALSNSLNPPTTSTAITSSGGVTTRATAGATSSQPNSMFGGVALPEGVDPSFLAALPESIRQEVIAEQLRLQRIQQATARQQQEAGQAGGSTELEVNPEFLAALPPNIQEEVLAQQRSEQARLTSEQTGSNPDLPVDPGSFISSLPQSLRQQVLSDMDDSMVAVLPPDLALEAQTLRQELEERHRRMVHDRIFSGVGSGSLNAILRQSGLSGYATRLRSPYAIRANISNRGSVFVSLLCLAQDDPVFAYEVLGMTRAQRQSTVKNLKVQCLARLNRLDEALTVMRSILHFYTADAAIRGNEFFSDTMEVIDAAVKNANNPELAKDYETIRSSLENGGHIATKTFKEFNQEPIRHRRNVRDLRGENSMGVRREFADTWRRPSFDSEFGDDFNRRGVNRGGWGRDGGMDQRWGNRGGMDRGGGREGWGFGDRGQDRRWPQEERREFGQRRWGNQGNWRDQDGQLGNQDGRWGNQDGRWGNQDGGNRRDRSDFGRFGNDRNDQGPLRRGIVGYDETD